MESGVADVLELRQQLRGGVLAKREELAPEVRHSASIEIIRRLRECLNDCTFIHCYISFRSEVETRELIEASIEKGMRVVVPVVEHIEGNDLLVHTEIHGLTGLRAGK